MSTLASLETFVAAARTGSFARAARQLGLSPAMVGRRIEALETTYGARLIERTTRSQRLTAVGEAFLSRAEAVLAAMIELNEVTRAEPGTLAGRVRVTGPATLGIHELAAISASFCSANPGVTLEMALNDRRADLIAEGYDFAVRIGELQASAMIARRIGTYRFRVAAAPAYLATAGTPRRPADLVGHRCILNLNITPRNRWLFASPDGAPEAVEVAGNLQIDNGEAHLAAALDGAGIVYLPERLVAGEIAARRLVEVLAAWDKVTMPINIVYPSRRRLPRQVAAFMDAIADGLRTETQQPRVTANRTRRDS